MAPDDALAYAGAETSSTVVHLPVVWRLGMAIMKPFLAFILLLGLASSDVAWSKSETQPLPAHAHRHRADALAHLKRHFRKALLRATASTTAAADHPQGADNAPGRAFAQDDASGPPQDPGWFMDRDSAGWGFHKGRTEALVGVYPRPPESGVPSSQIDQQDSGAAGLHVTLNLGH